MYNCAGTHARTISITIKCQKYQHQQHRDRDGFRDIWRNESSEKFWKTEWHCFPRCFQARHATFREREQPTWKLAHLLTHRVCTQRTVREPFCVPLVAGFFLSSSSIFKWRKCSYFPFSFKGKHWKMTEVSAGCLTEKTINQMIRNSAYRTVIFIQWQKFLNVFTPAKVDGKRVLNWPCEWHWTGTPGFAKNLLTFVVVVL